MPTLILLFNASMRHVLATEMNASSFFDLQDRSNLITPIKIIMDLSINYYRHDQMFQKKILKIVHPLQIFNRNTLPCLFPISEV